MAVFVSSDSFERLLQSEFGSGLPSSEGIRRRRLLLYRRHSARKCLLNGFSPLINARLSPASPVKSGVVPTGDTTVGSRSTLFSERPPASIADMQIGQLVRNIIERGDQGIVAFIVEILGFIRRASLIKILRREVLQL